MAINRYYTRTPAQPEFYHEPLDVLAQVLESKQKKYDTNFALAEELANQKINALPVDRPAANELVRRWQGSIDQAVANVGGDYSRIAKDIYKLKREMFNEMSPGGKGAAIAASYANNAAFLENEKKRLEKGEITTEDFNRAYKFQYDKYTGVGEKNPATQSYNMFNPSSTPKFVNFQDKALDTASKVVAHEFGSKNWQVDQATGEIFTMKGVKRETVSPERLIGAITMELTQDPETNAYRQGMAAFGVDVLPKEAFEGIAKQAVYMYAKDNLFTESDFKFAPEWMVSRREAQDNLAASQSLSTVYNYGDFEFGMDYLDSNISLPPGAAKTRGGEGGTWVGSAVRWLRGQDDLTSIRDVRKAQYDESNPYGMVMSKAVKAAEAKFGSDNWAKMPRTTANNEARKIANDYMRESSNTMSRRLNFGNDTAKALTEQLVGTGVIQQYKFTYREPGKQAATELTYKELEKRVGEDEMLEFWKNGAISQFNVGNNVIPSGLVWTTPGAQAEIVVHETDAYVDKLMRGVEKLMSIRSPEVFDTRSIYGMISADELNMPTTLGDQFYVKKHLAIDPLTKKLAAIERVYNQDDQLVTAPRMDEYGAPVLDEKGNAIKDPISTDFFTKRAIDMAIPQLAVLEGTKNSQIAPRN